MVTVFLPGAVETEEEVREVRMAVVEDREAKDVDPALHQDVIQLQQRELLYARRDTSSVGLTFCCVYILNSTFVQHSLRYIFPFGGCGGRVNTDL